MVWKWKADGDRTSAWQLVGSEEKVEIANSSIEDFDDEDSDSVWVTSRSFLQPTTLSLKDLSKGLDAPLQKVKALPSFFDVSGLKAEQCEAKSKDGTMVPFFKISKEGMPLDGSTPTLINAYGGFEISMKPEYDGSRGVTWLERGGCFVVANIRGGGEFGPAWHQVAKKAGRNKAFEDLFAVAETLIADKVTSAKKLAVIGGSNGGLLVGNALVQRPDLWGAIVCAVPLLDMQRFNKLLAGASWVGEYGDPDTDDWSFLKAFSPYHNVDPSKDYPPILFTGSTRDDRVHPGHARKMCKKLLDETSCKAMLYENIEGGHGGAADNKQFAVQKAIHYEFLWNTLSS